MQRSPVLFATLVGIGLLVTSSVARAQGFAVYEQSACMTGRGGAGVASPCADGSAVYFNPAGLSFDSSQLGLGAALISPRGDFTDDTTGQVSALNKKWYPVPNVFFSKPLTKRLAFGVGVFAPYGLTTDWPTSSQGRFLGYKSVVQGVYVQPTAAYKLSDQVSIGAGVDITYLNVELRQRLDLSTQTVPGTNLTFARLGVPVGTDFANVDLKGHSYHASFHVGLLAKASERVSFGARWMKGQRIKIDDGTISTQQIPTGTRYDSVLAALFAEGKKLSNQAVRTSIPMPDQVVVGVAVQATPKVTILADYEFSRWSMFDVLAMDGDYLQNDVVENYKDAHDLRLGADIALSPAAVLRVGFVANSAAAPDQTVTPNLPEGKRQSYTVGLGLRLSPRVSLDLGYLYLHQPERAGRTVHGTTAADNNGVYAFKAHIPTAMFVVRF